MSRLTLVSQPEGYFHEMVTEAMGRQKISAKPETAFYLGNLLMEFMKTEQLFCKDEQGNPKDPALALMVKEALEQPPETQKAMLKHVGDFSLYVAGFFPDSLNRKLVDVDYYIEMGGTAYQQAAGLTQEEVFRLIFSELSEKFSSFVDVLGEISDKTTPKSQQDLLRLYELWIRTRSERAAKALQEAGILPNQTMKKDWQ